MFKEHVGDIKSTAGSSSLSYSNRYLKAYIESIVLWLEINAKHLSSARAKPSCRSLSMMSQKGTSPVAKWQYPRRVNRA